mgnify:FL=1
MISFNSQIMDKKKHWENIYKTKEINGVSWYQSIPQESIDLISKFSRSKNEKIIDVGCGKGFLVDNLLKLGFIDISLLDISIDALDEVSKRIGNKKVKCIEGDILNVNLKNNFDIWHDRAVFHFITEREGIKKYVSICNEKINRNGTLIIGTFAEDGPLKCSGLEIKRYSIKNLKEIFKENFEFVEGFKKLHSTPFDTQQSFTFCVFKKVTNR